MIGKKASGAIKNLLTPSALALKTINDLPNDTCFEVATPKVCIQSRSIYEKYINVGKSGGYYPNSNDILIYENYVSGKVLCK